MKKVVLALAVLTCLIIGSRKTEARSCYGIYDCTANAPCRVFVDHVPRGFCRSIVRPGVFRWAYYGMGCSIFTNRRGAMGCANGAEVVEYWPPGEDFPECRITSTARLIGIGCCSNPCTPGSRDCEDE